MHWIFRTATELSEIKHESTHTWYSACGFQRFDDIKDKYPGKEGTKKRDQYEFDLKLDVLGDMIKQLRNGKKLTQAQLGEMIGVKKSKISKLERGSRNMTITTVLEIFRALKADIKFKIETKDNELNLV